jgi:hypothetical protein
VNLVSSSAGCIFSLPLESQKNLLVPRQITGTRTRPRKSLRLRVLEVDVLADTIPCCALRQGVSEVFQEGGFRFPVGIDYLGVAQTRKEQRVLVCLDVFLLGRVVFLIELIDCPLSLPLYLFPLGS